MDVMGGWVSCRNMTKRGGAEGAFFGFCGAKTCEFFETSLSYPQVGVLRLHGHRGRFSLKQTQTQDRNRRTNNQSNHRKDAP